MWGRELHDHEQLINVTDEEGRSARAVPFFVSSRTNASERGAALDGRGYCRIGLRVEAPGLEPELPGEVRPHRRHPPARVLVPAGAAAEHPHAPAQPPLEAGVEAPDSLRPDFQRA